MGNSAQSTTRIQRPGPPLPDDALPELLRFLPFHELQRMSLLNRRVAPLVIRQAEGLIERAGTGDSYAAFVEWRDDVVHAMHRRRFDAADTQMDSLKDDFTAAQQTFRDLSHSTDA